MYVFFSEPREGERERERERQTERDRGEERERERKREIERERERIRAPISRLVSRTLAPSPDQAVLKLFFFSFFSCIRFYFLLVYILLWNYHVIMLVGATPASSSYAHSTFCIFSLDLYIYVYFLIEFLVRREQRALREKVPSAWSRHCHRPRLPVCKFLEETRQS